MDTDLLKKTNSHIESILKNLMETIELLKSREDVSFSEKESGEEGKDSVGVSSFSLQDTITAKRKIYSLCESVLSLYNLVFLLRSESDAAIEGSFDVEKCFEEVIAKIEE